MSLLFESISVDNHKKVIFVKMLLSLFFLLCVVFNSSMVFAEKGNKKPNNVAKKNKNSEQNINSKTKKYNDWYYRCIEQKADKKSPARQCEVLQVAQVKSPSADKTSKKAAQNVSVLTLAFSKGLPDKKSKKRAVLLTVLTPLNIHLPSGFELTVDKNKPIKNVYRNCNQAGCWVNAQLSARDMKRLKKGKFGLGQMRLLNGQNVRIKFSLKGLGQALAALEKEEKIN